MINSEVAEKLIAHGNKVLYINAREYCDFPYGRTLNDSPDNCGSLFRDQVLLTAIKANPDILILDFSKYVIYPGASWFDEVFSVSSANVIYLQNHLVLKDSFSDFSKYFIKRKHDIVLKKQELFQREFDMERRKWTLA